MTDATANVHSEASREARQLGFREGALTPLEAIQARHSVRSYDDRPLPDAAIKILRQAIEFVNEEMLTDIQLVLDEPAAFAGFKGKRLGKFSGVSDYLVMVGPECSALDEALGYGGEKLVLLAQSLGLNTCWVGGTYKMVQGRYSVDMGQKLAAVIAIGYGTTQGKPHSSKAPEEVCAGYDQMPDWFKAGVDAALLAPTALNQQKFRLSLEGQDEDGLPLVGLRTKRGPFTKMDMGIARCHFEIGAGDAPFGWAS